jgi:hypothetical protein
MAAAASSKFTNFMNHPAGLYLSSNISDSLLIRSPPPGPKTVFFWAPVMKWCLVAAGVKDLSRPADKLSVSQNVGALPGSVVSYICFSVLTVDCLWGYIALAATGFIWVRYSLVIIPINYSLAAVSISSFTFHWLPATSLLPFVLHPPQLRLITPSPTGQLLRRRLRPNTTRSHSTVSPVQLTLPVPFLTLFT